jgi:hypothetical protein
MTVHYSCSIDNILNDLKSDKDVQLNEFKIRMEENLKMLNDQIYKLFDISFKSKNDIQDIRQIIEKVNELNINFSKIITDMEEYKKITNERIEKLFKLIVFTTEKLNISLPSTK